MKKIVCPRCGSSFEMLGNTMGRKPLNHSVKNVCDQCSQCSTVKAVADKLGCSRGYIYKVLKDAGLTAQEVLKKK